MFNNNNNNNNNDDNNNDDNNNDDTNNDDTNNQKISYTYDMIYYLNILEINKKEREKLTVDKLSRLYKISARKWHPDKNPLCISFSHEKMKQINEAYQYLKEYLDNYSLKHSNPKSHNINLTLSSPSPLKHSHSQELTPTLQSPHTLSQTTFDKTAIIKVMNLIELHKSKLNFIKKSLFEQYLMIALKFAVVDFVGNKNYFNQHIFFQISKDIWKLIAQVWFHFSDKIFGNQRIERMITSEYFMEYIINSNSNVPKLSLNELKIYVIERKKQIEQMVKIIMPTNPHYGVIQIESNIINEIFSQLVK